MRKTIDVRNIPCPGPVIEAKKALKEMTEGALTVLVDNAAAVQNLTKLASYLKLKSTSERLEEKTYQVTIQVGEGVTLPMEGKMEQAVCRTDDSLRGSVVVLSADHMGEGDEKLGRILMKGFVYALTNLEQLPETVLLYNGGVRLSVEGAETLEDLRLLEARGVEILSCGTCLNYYELEDKLGVGSVTNMYAIAEKMMQAKALLRP